MEANSASHVRYIILHTPGPKWKIGIDFREQPEIRVHVEHYRAIHAAGQLEMGGPFLMTNMGGMMIPIEGLSEQVVRQMAESDPAVQGGLLRAEVRAWYVPMSRSR